VGYFLIKINTLKLSSFLFHENAKKSSVALRVVGQLCLRSALLPK